MPPDVPPPQPPGGQGFGVVAEQLRTLAGFFEELEDRADGFETRVGELADGISGDQTGRCCRGAGDALKAGLQKVKDKVGQFGSTALDIRDALNDTARNYEQTDASGAGRIQTAGADL
jgi:Excreted virulence factor EspC, type VII ESX diderm